MFRRVFFNVGDKIGHLNYFVSHKKADHMDSDRLLFIY